MRREFLEPFCSTNQFGIFQNSGMEIAGTVFIGNADDFGVIILRRVKSLGRFHRCNDGFIVNPAFIKRGL